MMYSNKMSLTAKYNVPWQQYNIIVGYKKEKVGDQEVVTRKLLDDYLTKHNNVSLTYNSKSQIVVLTARNQKRLDSAKAEFQQMIANSESDFLAFKEKQKQSREYRNLQDFKKKRRELEESVKQALLNKETVSREVVKTSIATNTNNKFHLLQTEGDDSSDSEVEVEKEVVKHRKSSVSSNDAEEVHVDNVHVPDDTDWLPVSKMPVSAKSYRANRSKSNKTMNSSPANKNESNDFSDVEYEVVVPVQDSLHQLMIDCDTEFPPLSKGK